MNSGVRDQIRLELGEVDIQSAVKAQGCRYRRHDLADESVQVAISWSFDSELLLANVIYGLVVNDEGAIGIVDARICHQARVVRLHNGGGNLE